MRATLQSVILVWALSQQAPDVGVYRQSVDAYRDNAAPRGELADSLAAAGLAIVGQVTDPASGWTAANLAAAAMLHTEVAIRLAKVSQPQQAAAHVEAATALLRAALERDAGRAAFARRWRSTVSGLLHAYGARDLAASLRPDALAWLSDTQQQSEARAAFTAGLAEEIGAAVAGPLSGGPPRRGVTIGPEARRRLLLARRHFESALARDPADAEAALHLGRVMMITGFEADADRPLRVAAAAPDRPVRYLALMFLGAIAERQSRFADAEQLYLAARDAFPWGQSASLALSHVLMQAGREADARAAVARHFTRAGGRVTEPLWTYLADPATDLGPTLNLLRAEIWR